MKRIYLYYLFGVLGAFGGPVNEGDPAPGRSPGPPLNKSTPVFDKKYQFNDPQPTKVGQEVDQSQSPFSKRGGKSSPPVHTNTDYENLFCDSTGNGRKIQEYLKTSDILVKLDHTVVGVEGSGEFDQNTLAASHAPVSQPSLLNSLPEPPSDSVSPSTTAETARNRGNNDEDQHKLPPSLLFDVTHDVFDSKYGLMPGLVYKVLVNGSSTLQSFYIESSIGTFVKGSWPAPPAGRDPGAGGPSRSRGRSQRHRSKRQSGAKGAKSDVKGAECPNRNVWVEDFVYSDKYVMKWVVNESDLRHTNGNKLFNESTFATFRVLFRTDDGSANDHVYERTFSYTMLHECSLFVRHSSGVLDSSVMPAGYRNCSLTFPESISRPSVNRVDLNNGRGKGLLVQISRLNVPCSSGGFVRFVGSGFQRLCGKLEEIPVDDRTYHFKENSNTTIRVVNRPQFSVNYRVVDFCFNTTLSERNQTFFLQPSEALECHFTIHLPYGFRVRVDLVTNLQHLNELESGVLGNLHTNSVNEIASSINDNEYLGEKRPKSDKNLPINSDFNYNSVDNEQSGRISVDNSANLELSCDSGLSVQLFDANQLKWASCSDEFSRSERVSLLSTGNVMILKVVHRRGDAELDESQSLPSLYVDYSAQSVESIVSQCAFGWIAHQQFCLAAVHDSPPLTWPQAEQHCAQLGGHLVSIRSKQQQQLIDHYLIKSPGHKEKAAYWIGATDKSFEGDFHWTDNLPFSFANWFPGWIQFENYNKQPNDDGLSGQDCVEIRRFFRFPPVQQASNFGESPTAYRPGPSYHNHHIHQQQQAQTQSLESQSSLLNSFMWNDRDCNAKNHFICEKPMHTEDEEDDVEDALAQDYDPENYSSRERDVMPSSGFSNLEFSHDSGKWPSECNKTIQLTRDHPKTSVWSPGFPHQYPQNVDCYTLITAPQNYRIIIDFEELVIENEPQCSYDYLEVSETVLYHRPSSATHSNGEKGRFQHSKSNYQIYNKTFSGASILNPLSITSQLIAADTSLVNLEVVPRRMCGDWSPKLKLLRYVTKTPALALHFVSDYSHQFGGYKAKVYIENITSECGDERLRLHNRSCYLFNSYPEIDWWTAQQVCRSIGAQLSSVTSVDEQRFITANIRNDLDYSPRGVYWLGGGLERSGQFEWSDGTEMTFQDWLPGDDDQYYDSAGDQMCLGLQWKVSPTPMLPSGLYWAAKPCSTAGGYVCKRPKETIRESVVQNQTIVGSEGRLTSPNYPNPYPPNIDYVIKIIGPERTRLLVQFQKIDLEYQDECMYDYISVKNFQKVEELDPGTNPVPMAMLTDEMGGNEFGQRLNQEVQDGLYNAFNGWKMVRKREVTNVEEVLVRSEISLKEQIKLLETTDELIESQLKLRKKRYMTGGQGRVGRFRNAHLNTVHPSFQPYVRWCGHFESNMTRFDFISKSNQIQLHFHSDYSIAGSGFSATWNAVDITGCPLQTIMSAEGIVQSPNYPHFLLNHLDCTFIIQASVGKKILVEFEDFDVTDDAVVYLDLGQGEFRPFTTHNLHTDGTFLSQFEKFKVALKSGARPRGKGFKLKFRAVANPLVVEKWVPLFNKSSGVLYHLNFPLEMPDNVDFVQHLMVPLGEIMSLELHGVRLSENNCSDGQITGSLEIYDNYADMNGTKWILCARREKSDSESQLMTTNPMALMSERSKQLEQEEDTSSPVFITSYLNTIHIRQRRLNTVNFPGQKLAQLNATVKIFPDKNYKPKLASKESWVESCKPNPCQFGGKCVEQNATKKCECQGHFSGRFCGLTICDFDPCLFGTCELTENHFKCNCLPGYLGETCDHKQRPCSDNPCQGRGECFEKNGGFFCRCHAWWEGPRCDKKMIHIPYKPLSERMLQEPFWLGLITVFVVLAIIGLVWCAKRHFPEKIEKLLAEEADRNRPGSAHSHHTSLREQLQFTSSVPQSAIPSSAGAGTGGGGGGPGGPKSIFGRLGIRKPSILSLSSPQSGGAAARTFSLDDLLRPPPRRTPSPRKKRNNSTPTRKNAAEKKQILQQLISPGVGAAAGGVGEHHRPKLSLGELIQMSDSHFLKPPLTVEPSLEDKETTFFETSSTASTPPTVIVPDPKLEKKVTFARLLNKVSAEISSGSEIEVCNGNIHSHSSSGLNLLPVELPQRASSVPPSPCTNDIRSPHSTSSNQGSDSLSGSDLTLPDFGKNRRNRLKVSSADSILAMFKNYNSSSFSLGQSFIISPTNTPTISSPQEDVPGDDDSSTSSMHTPVSFSSGAPDSPVYFRQGAIEVPVLDPLTAHKTNPGSNLLHPPTILLEIPSGNNSNINKCLSPIRELPTPMPSPALTPIMPRPQRTRSPSLHDDPMSNSNSEDEENSKIELFFKNLTQHQPPTLLVDGNRTDSEVDNISIDTPTTKETSPTMKRSKFQIRAPAIAISIDVEPPTPTENETFKLPTKPRELIIPTVTIEQPSPTKTSPRTANFPGSPPPQRASIGETSFLFPNKQQQKRLLKQLEKPTSLDLTFAPPIITVTANMSEAESDMENLSPAPKQLTSNHLLGVPGQMCYLSPFSIVSRTERTTSESNLSSSGYSSMASPGPSRCSSNNPLYPGEADDPGSGHSHGGLPGAFGMRRHSHTIKNHPTILPGASNQTGTRDRNLRHRSDSETLSDEPILESNDEGIGTDHIDEKIEDGEIKSAKDLELYIGKDLIETGKSLLAPESEAMTMAQLQLPAIVIQSESGDRALSPVSSRSESPLSERTTGFSRFSPLFYGKKDQQLPFTDSDGLYDFPSSDGKGNYLAVNHRKSVGKRKERKSSKSGQSPSPHRGSTQLDVPGKEPSPVGHQHHSPPHSKYHSFMNATSGSRKSPKRRPVQRHPIASSSSSSESLALCKDLPRSSKASPTKTTCLTYSHENATKVTCDSGEEIEEQLPLCQPTKDDVTTGLPRKLHRLRAIGNQIRFLRRLQKSIQQRVHQTDSDDNDTVTSPLLETGPSAIFTKANKAQLYKLNRQKRLPQFGLSDTIKSQKLSSLIND